MGNIHYVLISDSITFLELQHVTKGRYCNTLSFSIGFSAIKKKIPSVGYILFTEANFHIRSLLSSNTSGAKPTLSFKLQD